MSDKPKFVLFADDGSILYSSKEIEMLKIQLTLEYLKFMNGLICTSILK